MKNRIIEKIKLYDIINGGQAIGKNESGKKIIAFGGLPGETVNIQVLKNKTSYIEGLVTEVLIPSKFRESPLDPDSYLSTSPWQIMNFNLEQKIKSKFIKNIFDHYDIDLINYDIYTDNKQWGYRNKIEFSFWFDTNEEKLYLAFYRRGTHSKIKVEGTSLANDNINVVANKITDILNKNMIGGKDLKTLLIRSNQKDQVSWQLYLKNKDIKLGELIDSFNKISNVINFELIYSDPKSPASVKTKSLFNNNNDKLCDEILNTKFYYSTESFFQINVPVYIKLLEDIKSIIETPDKLVDYYCGVGTIGLSIGKDNVTFIDSDTSSMNELKLNINNRKNCHLVNTKSELSLNYIDKDATIILDPPRAGLHKDVVNHLIKVLPNKIIYISCNPITQARDINYFIKYYSIKFNKGYNFFPKTPHIEHLIILERKSID